MKIVVYTSAPSINHQVQLQPKHIEERPLDISNPVTSFQTKHFLNSLEKQDMKS
jgi:hypothetical protein